MELLWRRHWQPTPVLLPGESQGWRSLVGCSPWGRCESDTTEWLHFHFSFSCIGGGNDNLLQCSCLENPRNGGAWWATVCGVAQSQTWVKWLSSSSIMKKDQRNTKYPTFPLQRCKGHEIYYNTVERVRVTVATQCNGSSWIWYETEKRFIEKNWWSSIKFAVWLIVLYKY